MKFGIDRLLEDASLRRDLKGRRVALCGHPASVSERLVHSMDALAALDDIDFTAAFGPQHGMKGDKQYNMIESESYIDPVHKVPVHSLYGEVRRPTDAMMDDWDVVLVDLQDVGCRIYTFLTTLLYLLEAGAKHGKAVWVLDRPNPAGRPIEGPKLQPGYESFVGAGPIPMRHGMTLGEMGHWFIDHFKLDVDYRVIEMQGYDPDGPGHGWPTNRVWINPSPNAPSVNMARVYAGTVMVEATHLSEGRGTTRPLEIFGAPDINARTVIAEMQRIAPQWLTGSTLREIWFEPTFYKHSGALCHGVHIHAEGAGYDHPAFKAWRVQALAFKAIRTIFPEYDLWRGLDYEYEYTSGRLAIDTINGGPSLREWVDNEAAAPADLESIAAPDEEAWAGERAPFLLY